MAVMTVELVESIQVGKAERVGEAEWVEDVPCDERCVWCNVTGLVAHTVDGFCEFCGATGHPCH